MKEIADLLKNVKKGPKTSIVGALMMIFGGYLIYNNETDLEWASVPVGLFAMGAYLCLTSDSIFSKKDDKSKVDKSDKGDSIS
jgi:hypothetical protein